MPGSRACRLNTIWPDVRSRWLGLDLVLELGSRITEASKFDQRRRALVAQWMCHGGVDGAGHHTPTIVLCTSASGHDDAVAGVETYQALFTQHDRGNRCGTLVLNLVREPLIGLSVAPRLVDFDPHVGDRVPSAPRPTIKMGARGDRFLIQHNQVAKFAPGGVVRRNTHVHASAGSGGLRGQRPNHALANDTATEQSLVPSVPLPCGW